MIKLILNLAAVSVLISSQNNTVSSNNAGSRSEHFLIDAQINGLGRNYVGCGVLKYSVCAEGTIKSTGFELLGKSVVFIIQCPEILNDLAPGNNYKLEVVYNNEKSNDGTTSCEDRAEILNKKIQLKVLSIKRVW